jgi:hypothetical protein
MREDGVYKREDRRGEGYNRGYTMVRSDGEDVRRYERDMMRVSSMMMRGMCG